jgi:N-acetylglucosamine-6-phosphate deacetylase
MKVYSRNCLINGKFMPATLEIEAGVVSKVTIGQAAEDGTFDRVFEDGFLIPGLIDVQINGAAGVDFSSASASQASQALTVLAKNGTTSVCPTVITSPLEQINGQIQMLSVLEPTPGAARNLGVHLEGPVINSAKRGAHQEELLLSPEQLLASKVDLKQLKLLTVAPELPAVNELIISAVKNGVVVSLGHSEATAKQTSDAAENGAQMVTHLFNGMREIHQREPGIAIEALTNDKLHFGIIVDGEHVSYELVKLAQRLAPERMIVVSDASAALKSVPGSQLQLGGSTVIVDETGTARRQDGTMASSGLTQLEAIEKAVSNGLDREQLLVSASKVPADLLREGLLGRIEVGASADLVHYVPSDLPKIDFVMVNGELCQL